MNAREMELAVQLEDATRQCGAMADLLREVHEYIFNLKEQPRREYDRGCEILDDIDALLAGKVPEPASQWIPCSERLPPNDDLVLIYDESLTPGSIYIVSTNRYSRACLSGEEFSETWRGVTHWMPLPSAPKPQGWEARAKLTNSAEEDRQCAELIAAAQAVVDRWDSPLWKDQQPTAALIHVLRQALMAAQKPQGGEA